MPTSRTLAKNLDRLRSIAMALPEATEEVTWGTDINFRVRKKIFAFPGQGGSLTVKADREELPALLADTRFSAGAVPRSRRLGVDGSHRIGAGLGRDRRADSYLVLPDRPEEARCATRLSCSARGELVEFWRSLQGLGDPRRIGQALSCAQPADGRVPVAESSGAASNGERRDRRSSTTVRIGGVVGRRVVLAEAQQDVGERILGVGVAGRQRPRKQCDEGTERFIVGGVGWEPAWRAGVGEVVEQARRGQCRDWSGEVAGWRGTMAREPARATCATGRRHATQPSRRAAAAASPVGGALDSRWARNIWNWTRRGKITA